MAGMEDFVNDSSPLDSFYGSINTAGDGNLIFHERYDDIVDIVLMARKPRTSMRTFTSSL